jgi:hypothetical protein
MDSQQQSGFEHQSQLAGPEADSMPVSPEVTAQYLASIIFLSYRFSQGGIGTQNRMLLYIEENFYPDLMKGDEQVQALTHRMVGRYFLDQKLHPATAIPWEDDSPEAAVKTQQLVTNELAGLFGRFKNRTEIRAFTSDIVGIAQSVIVMDADYLRRAGGRAGDSEELKIVVDPYARDPYDSLFMKHSVLEKNTNAVEYDEIFQMLATEAVVSQFDQYALRQLQYVIDVYVSRHPGSENDEDITQIKILSERLSDAR